MFDKIKTTRALARFLSIDYRSLSSFKVDDYYRSFEIPKPGKSEKRLIETPVSILRLMLDRIGNELQNIYQYRKTDAAYGFIRSLGRNDPDKRNIYSNAARHLEKKYLLNIDLDDFFYQIDEFKVNGIFNNYTLFSFDRQTEETITRLVTYRGRLPMGSPTSPPLSNLATISLDEDLIKWSLQNRFTYTRYVDDLSFSSNIQITNSHFNQINEILQSHQFRSDPKKTKWYGKNDTKEITGLLLGKKISVPEAFITEFNKDLEKYKNIWIMAHQHPDYHVFEWINKLNKVINGRLAFLSMIYNNNHPIYREFVKKFEAIKHLPESELSCSWRYAGYEI